MIKRSVVVWLLLSLSFVMSCRKEDAVRPQEGREGAPAVTVEAGAPVLSKPIKMVQYEIDVQALTDFLPHRGKTLVLYSIDPFLVPIPEAIKRELPAATGQGGRTLARRLWRVADPLLLPGMLTSAVLEERLFRRIVWVVPTSGTEEQIDLDRFKSLLKSVGQGGGDTFRREKDGNLSGVINGVRFDVVRSNTLPPLTEPAVVHVDLGYFFSRYKNAIKTPLLPLIGETLVTLRKTACPVGLVTFSYSNHSEQAPLIFRPVGTILHRLFAEPQLLDKPLPESWRHFGDILYLENFFQNEEISRLLGRMETLEPNAAWVKYLQSNFVRHFREDVEADRLLAEAVKGDVGYALDYLQLIKKAPGSKRSEQTLDDLRKLESAFPEDPFFQMVLCNELIAQKKYDEARSLLTKLRRLNWSQVYYPEIPGELEQLQGSLDLK